MVASKWSIREDNTLLAVACVVSSCTTAPEVPDPGARPMREAALSSMRFPVQIRP